MKPKPTFALAVLVTFILSPLLHAAIPAPLPDFMDGAQMAKWTVNSKGTDAAAATVDVESRQFYTGKPYIADAGGYVYKYRIYNPELSRWTSADPSGFRDGVNNFIYVGGKATYCLDDDGLATLESGTPSSSLSLTMNTGGNDISYQITITATDSGLTESTSGHNYNPVSSDHTVSPLTATGSITGSGPPNFFRPDGRNFL